MTEPESSKFNSVLRQIIEKSLFTERQIEIILNQKDLEQVKFPITRGAYYRQVGQSRHKLMGLYYSIILLRGLGVLLPDDIDVISDVSDQIAGIKDSDVPPESSDKIINVVEEVVRRACNM